MSTLTRAAASSSASGRLSSRPHSSATSSSDSMRARAQNSSTASGSASAGTGYTTSPSTRSNSRLVTNMHSFGHARSSAASSTADSTTCSRLSSTRRRLLLADVLRQLLGRSQRLRDRRQDQCRVAHRCQPDPEHSRAELAHQLPGRLERQPRLPGPSRPGKRHEPRRLLANERDDLPHLLLAPHERRERHGQVRVRDRPQRRKALETRAGTARPARRSPSTGACPARASSPTTSSCVAADSTTWPPWAALMILAALCTSAPTYLGGSSSGLARVHADPDTHRPVGKRRHRLRHRSHRLRRRPERVEEPVARVIDLVARMRGESLPHSPTMFGQRLLDTPPRRARPEASSSPRCP